MPAHVVLHAGLKGGHCRPGAGEAVTVKGLAGVDDEAVGSGSTLAVNAAAGRQNVQPPATSGNVPLSRQRVAGILDIGGDMR